MRCTLTAIVAAALVLLTACQSTTARHAGGNDLNNPSFVVTYDDALTDLKRMRGDKQPLQRPVLILAGFYDPGLGPWDVARRLRDYTDDARIIQVHFIGASSFDECRRRVIDAVDDALPSDDPTWTSEVDVLGVSMGGLVARYAAAPFGERRLRVRRLITFASPHAGAALAELDVSVPLRVQMQADSPFIDRLEAVLPNAAYELVPYVRLGDEIVGECFAAPRGWNPWWVSARPLEMSHPLTHRDARIWADTLRRLRGEQPFTQGEPAPLPISCEDDEASTPTGDQSEQAM